MTEELHPIGYMEGGKLTGLGVEMVREMLKILKLPDNIQVLPWPRAYNYIQSKPNHILFAMGRSPAREQLFKWVGPLISNQTFFYQNTQSNIKITSMEEAKKVNKIGVMISGFNHTLLKSLGFKNLIPNTNYNSLLNMLKQGRLDLVPAGVINIDFVLREAGISRAEVSRSDVMVYDSKLYIAFSKDIKGEVITQWQIALQKIKENGVHNKIYKKYLGNDP